MRTQVRSQARLLAQGLHSGLDSTPGSRECGPSSCLGPGRATAEVDPTHRVGVTSSTLDPLLLDRERRHDDDRLRVCAYDGRAAAEAAKHEGGLSFEGTWTRQVQSYAEGLTEPWRRAVRRLREAPPSPGREQTRHRPSRARCARPSADPGRPPAAPLGQACRGGRGMGGVRERSGPQPFSRLRVLGRQP